MRQSMKSLLVTLVALLAAPQVFAEVAAISFEKLVQNSEIIVVADVEAVSKTLLGKRYAKAKVIEVWKGKPSEKIEFLASPTWTCDISDAKKGERVLLFLMKTDNSRSYAITHSGRGRMPFQSIAGTNCVKFASDVILPKELSAVDPPDRHYNSMFPVDPVKVRDVVTRLEQKRDKER
jgi:hypothetical protein